VAVDDDLVQREFSAEAPGLVWLTDISEHPTSEGTLYCCAVKDVFSNRIVGYAIGERMTAPLAVSALRQAIARRRPHGTVVVHSDRGSQFRSRSFRAVLRGAGLTGSTGRVASAGDHGAMESFFALLQVKRARPSPLAHQSRAALRDRPLDRTHLQPTTPPTRARQTHPDRVRARVRTHRIDPPKHCQPNSEQTRRCWTA
jgi:transposase InsO family protein